MAKPISEHGFSAEMCLTRSELRLFRDEPDGLSVPVSGGSVPRFDKEKMRRVLELAEHDLTAEIPFCPASLYIRFVRDGNRSEYERVYFRRREMALRLALAEAYEKQGRFTDKLMDAVWAIMEESTWTVPAHLAMYSPSHGDRGLAEAYTGELLHAIDLFSAATGALLATVYLLDKDALDGCTPVICEKLKYEVVHRQLEPFLQFDYPWSGLRGNPVNNWNPWVLSNLLFAAAVLVDDDETRKAIVARAALSADNYTRFLPPDAGCDEGPSYWNLAGAAFFDCLELLYDLTGGRFDIFDDPFIRKMCEYEPKMYIHGTRFINFADCPPHVHPDGSQLARMGRKCGSPVLERFGDVTALFGDVYLSHNNVYRTLRNLLMPEHAADRSTAFTRSWLPSLKIMSARQFEQTDRGMFVAMKGGHNAEGHNHIDVGNVLVYYDGEPVLIDTGAGTYTRQTFSNRRYELWYMQSGYHNVPDIGGYCQCAGGRYRSDEEVYDEASGGVKMQLKAAYPAEAGIVSYTRETVLEGGNVRITDAFELDGVKDIDIHFITCAKPVLTQGQTPCSKNDRCTIALAGGRTMRFDPRLTPEIEEFAVNDGGLERSWKTPVLWRIHLRAQAENAVFVTEIY